MSEQITVHSRFCDCLDPLWLEDHKNFSRYALFDEEGIEKEESIWICRECGSEDVDTDNWTCAACGEGCTPPDESD